MKNNVFKNKNKGFFTPIILALIIAILIGMTGLVYGILQTIG